MAQRVDCRIVNHGIYHAQEFEGYGRDGTRFAYCVTGCGDSAKEAYEDACEMIGQVGHSETAAFLPRHPRGIRADQTIENAFPGAGEGMYGDVYYYVSVLYNPLDR